MEWAGCPLEKAFLDGRQPNEYKGLMWPRYDHAVSPMQYKWQSTPMLPVPCVLHMLELLRPGPHSFPTLIPPEWFCHFPNAWNIAEQHKRMAPSPSKMQPLAVPTAHIQQTADPHSFQKFCCFSLVSKHGYLKEAHPFCWRKLLV